MAVPQTENSAAGFVVRIHARDDSWLSVSADGQAASDETLAAGSEKTVEGQRAITIKAGNVGGLDFWFNGTKIAVPGDYDEVKTLNFGTNGLETTAAAKVQPVAMSVDRQR